MEKWLGFPTVRDYNGLKLNELPLNHAFVIANTSVDNVGVYTVKDDCFNCPYKLEKYLKAGEQASWEVDTSSQRLWRIMRREQNDQVARNNRRGILCQMRPTLHEFGVYRLDVGNCEVRPEEPPVNSYLPLLLCSLVLLLGLLIAYFLAMLCSRRNKEAKQEKVLNVNAASNDNNAISLHIFKDILMSLIIFSTTGGGGYPIFKNEWGGLSLAECLFFAYSWSVGVHIPAVMNEASNQQSKCAIIGDIFKRAFVLIFLGILIDSTVCHKSGSDHISLWIPLQRLGVAYFIVASAYVLTVQRFEMKSKRVICKAIGNLVSLMWCWILSGFLLAIIIVLISTFISFNCLANTSLEQKADYSYEFPETLNCNNDTSEYANKIFVAEVKKIVNVNSYLGFSRGLMGFMSTIMYTMIGLKAGIVSLYYQSYADRLKLWSFWATLFGLGSIIFAGISYPLNFNLWPISTILFISTMSLYIFAVVYIIFDIWKLGSTLTSGATSSVSIAVLCGHQLFSSSLPFSWNMWFRSHIMYLLQNIWIVFLWLVIGGILKRKVKFQV